MKDKDINEIIKDIKEEEHIPPKKKRKRRVVKKIHNTDTLFNNIDEEVSGLKDNLKRKKDFMRYRKSHLKKGAILPIYVNWKDQDTLMGYARLNKRISEPKDEQPYERVSIGSGRIKEQDMVIYKHQRWNVTFVDPIEYNPDISQKERFKYIAQKDFTTNRNIAYFETVDSNHIS